MLAPGILVAATGVGAGDLLTASLGGSAVGVAIVWAAVAGAVLKWFLNEGLARWQMATGTTLLEGWVERLGAWSRWVFITYLLAWTFFTGGAMVTACGVAGTGLLPLHPDPTTSKVIWGVIHSFVGLILVLAGGFRLFEKLMSACIAVMFAAVIFTAVQADPDWSAVGAGLLPSIPEQGTGWILGILGGVGGTLTLLSYGYWIREKNRTGPDGVRACRIDLAVGYTMTALFGVAMVMIGSKVDIGGRGVRVAPLLADQLGTIIGPAGRWIFLVGFWGAVFSSLLGVWQSVPYMFSDFYYLTRRKRDPEQPAKNASTIDLARTAPYRIYLVAIALIPLPVLWFSVKKAQLIYAVMGAMFMPLLALTLLIMNNRADWVGRRYRSGVITNLALAAVLLLFVYIGLRSASDALATLVKSPAPN